MPISAIVDEVEVPKIVKLFEAAHDRLKKDPEHDVFVTVEPCLMCVGALVHARIGTLVYGAPEPRTGAVTSTVKGGELPGHNHRFEVVGGVREDDCRTLVQEFFRSRRA